MQIPKNLHILSTGLWSFSCNKLNAMSFLKAFCTEYDIGPLESQLEALELEDAEDVHILIKEGSVIYIDDIPAGLEKTSLHFKEFYPNWMPMSEYLGGVNSELHKKNRECKNLRIRLKTSNT